MHLPTVRLRLTLKVQANTSVKSQWKWGFVFGKLMTTHCSEHSTSLEKQAMVFCFRLIHFLLTQSSLLNNPRSQIEQANPDILAKYLQILSEFLVMRNNCDNDGRIWGYIQRNFAPAEIRSYCMIQCCNQLGIDMRFACSCPLIIHI